MHWSFNTNSIKISTLPVQLPRLPAEFNRYKMTQISDFHLGTWLDPQDLFEIVDMVNSLESDLIAITGDFVSSEPEKYAPSLIQALSKLVAKDAKTIGHARIQRAGRTQIGWRRLVTPDGVRCAGHVRVFKFDKGLVKQAEPARIGQQLPGCGGTGD